MAHSAMIGVLGKGNAFKSYAGSARLNGGKTLAGVVTRNGVAARAVIWVHDRDSGALVFRTRSAADGSWSLTNLRGSYTYYAICFDPAGQFNAQAADLLTPA